MVAALVSIAQCAEKLGHCVVHLDLMLHCVLAGWNLNRILGEKELENPEGL